MSLYSASIELGTILRKLPLSFYDAGPVNAVRVAYACGFADRLWSKRAAMRLLFAANLERGNAYGHGNRAKRRAGLMTDDTISK